MCICCHLERWINHHLGQLGSLACTAKDSLLIFGLNCSHFPSRILTSCSCSILVVLISKTCHICRTSCATAGSTGSWCWSNASCSRSHSSCRGGPLKVWCFHSHLPPLYIYIYIYLFSIHTYVLFFLPIRPETGKNCQRNQWNPNVSQRGFFLEGNEGMPSAQALQKRFDIIFVPEDYYPDSTYESIATAASKQQIHDFHSRMFEKARMLRQHLVYCSV